MDFIAKRTPEKQLEFWSAFNNYAKNTTFTNNYSLTTPYKENFYRLQPGFSKMIVYLYIDIKKQTIRVAMYFDHAHDLFDKLENYSEEFAQIIGETVEWKKTNKDAYAMIAKYFDINIGKDYWPAAFDWYCEKALQIQNFLKKYYC